MYECIVFWKKNMIFASNRCSYKKYIIETTKLMNGWTKNSPFKHIAFTAIHVMSSLLQKPSKTSKAKDHLKALEKRIDLWIRGNIDELLFEGETIQSYLHHINIPKSIGELSKKFALLMEKENVNGALKLLRSTISNGILPLDDKTLSLLKQKHPASSELNNEVLLRGEKPSVHPVVFEDIGENMVKEAVLKTKGGSGTSGLDADGERFLCPRQEDKRLPMSLEKYAQKSSLLTQQKMKHHLKLFWFADSFPLTKIQDYDQSE